MTKRITYLDNAATTPVRPEVLEAMLPYLGSEAFGNPSSAHRFGRSARAGIEAAKRAVANAVGAEPNQVVFTSGGTEADNLAIIGSALAARDRGGPFRVAVSAVEHKAVLAAAHAVRHLGGEEILVGVSASGIVEEEALDEVLARGVALVSVMWVNNEIGTIQPIARLAELAHAAGARFHCDAVQAVGKIPVSVREAGVDLLSLAGHKFHGPPGAAALYVRRRTRLVPLVHGGHQERSRRAGTENLAAIVGLGAAAERAARWLASEGPKRLATLAERLRR